MARPKKQDTDKLSMSLPPVRCTADDYALIQHRAAEAGQTLTAYIRQMALNGKITVHKSNADFTLIEELRYSGNNLNQLTKRYHSSNIEPQELRNALDAHGRLLSKIMESL